MIGPKPRRLAFPVLAFGAVVLAASHAGAQIKQPGNHPMYDWELEPHFLVQWDSRYWSDEGVGLGLRASIPLMDNGPVPKINNNIAIGFGLDWAHFSDNCWGFGPFNGPRGAWNGYDCSENDIWLPAVAQWNFFFTPVVSAFGEFGLGFRYASWSADCPVNNCNYDDSDLDLEPLFAIGPRFIFNDSFGLLVRIGWPYFSVGASFLL